MHFKDLLGLISHLVPALDILDTLKSIKAYRVDLEKIEKNKELVIACHFFLVSNFFP